MTDLDHLLSTNEASVDTTGRWFSIQWIPDRASMERLNIGVGFVSEKGEKSYRLLDIFHRVECIYDSSAVFQAELACNVAREAIEQPSFEVGWYGSTIQTVDRGFAQGTDEREIVNRLFSETVPLGKPDEQPHRREPFSHVPLEKAYSAIREFLKTRLELSFSEHVPDDPYLRVEDGFGQEELYLPFRRSNGVATLATAAYADPMRVYRNLYEGFRFVETARLRNITERSAIFFLLPGDGIRPEAREEIEEEIDGFYQFVKRHGVQVESHTGVEPLGGMIADWCEEAA